LPAKTGLGLERFPVLRVARKHHPKIGLSLKLDSFDRSQETAPGIMAGREGRLAGALRQFPFADQTGIGDFAAELHAGAEDIGLEILKLPGVVREEEQFSADIAEEKGPARLVGAGQRPDQASIAQDRGVSFQVEMTEGFPIQTKLGAR